MKWLRDNAISLFMAAVVVLAAAAGYGAIRQQVGDIDAKADRETVYRELDQLRATVNRIEGKVDELLKRPTTQSH